MTQAELDRGWYLLVHGDVEEAGMDPADHLERFGRAEGRTGVSPIARQVSEREFAGRWEFFLRAFSALAHNRIPGAYVEFGTGRGATLWCASRAGECTTPRPIWSFDSFQGLPASTAAIDDHPAWKPGLFAQPLEAVRSRLARAGVDLSEITFVKGFFSETLGRDRRERLPREIALAYVDCDLYASTVTVLDYLADVLRHGMIVAFDDYFCWSPEHVSGEQAAFTEWSARRSGFRFHPYLPIGWHGMSFYVERVRDG